MFECGALGGQVPEAVRHSDDPTLPATADVNDESFPKPPHHSSRYLIAWYMFPAKEDKH